MRTRLVAASVVLGAALLGAAWLVTYQAWYPYSIIDYPSGKHLATFPVKQYPWWSPYAAIALVVVGAALADRLVPEARRVIRREARRLGRASVAHLLALLRRAPVRWNQLLAIARLSKLAQGRALRSSASRQSPA